MNEKLQKHQIWAGDIACDVPKVTPYLMTLPQDNPLRLTPRPGFADERPSRGRQSTADSRERQSTADSRRRRDERQPSMGDGDGDDYEEERPTAAVSRRQPPPMKMAAKDIRLGRQPEVTSITYRAGTAIPWAELSMTSEDGLTPRQPPADDAAKSRRGRSRSASNKIPRGIGPGNGHKL